MFAHCAIALKHLTAGRRSLALAFIVLFAFCASLSYAQHPAPAPLGAPPVNPTPPPFVNSKAPDYGPPAERTPTFQELQYRRYLLSRLKSMVSDTDKLLRLEQEMSAKIQKTGAGSLTHEDLRTMAEIEKLAHNIKWKMQLATDQSHAP